MSLKHRPGDVMAIHEQQYWIIIVDDQHDVRKVLREAVEDLGIGCQVIDTPSAEEAWLIISSQPVDLLVLDVRLPGISGLEFFKRLRSRKPDIKVILITGVADPAIRREASEAQADAFFLKPIGLAEFQETVKRLLQKGKVKTDTVKTDEELSEKPRDSSLQRKLSDLKERTAAEGVLLLGRDGKTLSCVGSHPTWLSEAGWVHSLLLSYRIGIRKLFSEKITSIETILSIKGPGLQVTFIPLNPGYVLLLWSGKEQGLLPAPIEVVEKLAGEISDSLSTFPVPDPLPKNSEHEPIPSVPEKRAEIRQETEKSLKDQEIDKILSERHKERLGTKELNTYWESLPSDAGKRYEREKESITFEEAKKLGLNLDEEEGPNV
jgi:CheY-like chemotaxis protein